MQFDIFHSIGRIDSIEPRVSDAQVFAGFFAQVRLAENLGFDTVWVAESHFSSEVQKRHKEPVIPHYRGEVGLNSDSFQLFNMLMQQTARINFGTAIHNIVGGNGGPIASADRVGMLAFLNAQQPRPRTLNIGVASGRFPYINAPFGIYPRDDEEKRHWPEYRRLIFLEALEIFLRLVRGETLAADAVTTRLLSDGQTPYRPRWVFEALKLVPELNDEARAHLNFVLGSHDPWARELGFSLTDLDVFNLSFTPPEQLNQIHDELTTRCQKQNRRPWCRSRMPRTVLIFIDEQAARAAERAAACFDTYIEAMRGTAEVPVKDVLMKRALIGTPKDIAAQLCPQDPRGFAGKDRLMLWFEFNQSDTAAVEKQMQLFAEEVMPQFKQEDA